MTLSYDPDLINIHAWLCLPLLLSVLLHLCQMGMCFQFPAPNLRSQLFSLETVTGLKQT